MTPSQTDEEQNVERRLREDRVRLRRFVDNLNRGVDFNDMDDDLKAWWMNRY